MFRNFILIAALLQNHIRYVIYNDNNNYTHTNFYNISRLNIVYMSLIAIIFQLKEKMLAHPLQISLVVESPTHLTITALLGDASLLLNDILS
jgi:hypothetical protein